MELEFLTVKNLKKHTNESNIGNWSNYLKEYDSFQDDDGGKTLSTRDLILDRSYSKGGGGYLSSKNSYTYSLTS